MVELDQFKYTLNGYTEPLKEVRDSLDLENKEKRVEELEREMEAPGFWDNAERSQKMMKELSALKGDMEIYHKLQNQKEEIELMIEMGYEENDPSVIPDIQEMLDEFIQDFAIIRIKTLLSENMTRITLLLFIVGGRPFMLVLAEQSPVTGQVCCTVCICAGQIDRDLPQKYWIIWMEMRQELNLLPFR